MKLASDYRLQGKNKIYSVLIAAIIVIGVLSLSGPALKNAFQGESKDQTLNANEIKIEANLSSSQLKNDALQSGGKFTAAFKIGNTGLSSGQLLKLNTGINKYGISEVSNLKGATGYSYEEDELVIQNVSVSSNQQVDVSFDIQLFQSKSSFTVSTFPKLYSQTNELIKQGDKRTITVNASSDTNTFNSTKAEEL